MEGDIRKWLMNLIPQECKREIKILKKVGESTFAKQFLQKVSVYFLQQNVAKSQHLPRSESSILSLSYCVTG